jgi:hypothetical protein
MVAAAGSITLNPNAQVPGSIVSVSGISFGATKPVAIGFGAEVTVTNESHPIASVAGTGPFTAITNHYPIKPGSFYFHCVVSSDTNVVESNYYDNGDGTLATDSTYSINHFVNYVTGQFGRSSTSAWDGYTVVFTASYTYYQYNVTPAAGVTTSASGVFSADITVPSAIANGAYNVTALDVSGNSAASSLTVDSTIPEGLTIGVIVLVSSFAAIVGSRFRERSRILK